LKIAAVAQLVERVLGKDEVTGPIPVSSLLYLLKAAGSSGLDAPMLFLD
jgi:hypothetical protein